MQSKNPSASSDTLYVPGVRKYGTGPVQLRCGVAAPSCATIRASSPSTGVFVAASTGANVTCPTFKTNGAVSFPSAGLGSQPLWNAA
jgi:hypothetical protein